jgi:hypoxanthine-DNA glycosylase
MSKLLGFELNTPYDERVKALQLARISLWDVLLTCNRPGSLDSDIDPDSLIANDLAGFLHQHPAIKRVFFNGAKAESCFRKHIAPTLAAGSIACQRLPSTSPAHASLALEQKLAAWRIILADRH